MKNLYYKWLKWWMYQSFECDLRLLYRTSKKPYTSTGLGIRLGLFHFSFMLGWKVKEAKTFPIFFEVSFFERAPNMDAILALHVGWRVFSFSRSYNFGIARHLTLHNA